MGDIPVVTYLVPVLVVVVLAALLVQRRLVVARTQRQYGHFRLADLAHRLRLNVVEGDPELNMALVNAYYTTEARVRLLGEPYGHPTEFVFYTRSEQERHVSSTTIHTWFDCRLRIQVPVAFPAFEIVPRRQKRSTEIRPELSLPGTSFGDAGLDGVLSLMSAEPGVGPVLAEAAAELVRFGYLHVQGSGGMLSFLLNRTGYLAGLGHLEEAQQVLERMARSLTAGPAHRVG